uniref:Methyltransferase domain-containing protein n=1 Tax=Scophthalmus maximus TaxID=52904 RepID=A0A8D3BNQ4_SCOMX
MNPAATQRGCRAGPQFHGQERLVCVCVCQPRQLNNVQNLQHLRVNLNHTWNLAIDYRAPHLAVNFLSENFTGTPEESLVLDVACGTGLVAKLMVELGFRRFVGVDGSKGMLDQAAESGLYQDLNQALLGSDPLPAQPGAFDVVMIIGALRPGFVPVSVIKEIYQAAKPGNQLRSCAGDEYKVSMEQELQLMEDEGLWTLVATKEMHRYMLNFYQNYNEGEQNEHYLNGTMYLYRKAHNES